MEINLSFLRSLKNGDEVILVDVDHKGAKKSKKATVISRGSKWVTVATSPTSSKRRFGIEDGREDVNWGHRATLWESESVWSAFKERGDAWDVFRKLLDKHRSDTEPPKNLSLEEIRHLTEIVNGIFSEK